MINTIRPTRSPFAWAFFTLGVFSTLHTSLNATQEPPGCQGNSFDIAIERAFGQSAFITNNSLVSVVVTYSQPILTPANQIACNLVVTNGTFFVCPGPTGTSVGGTSTQRFPANQVFIPGAVPLNNLQVAFTNTCLISVDPQIGSALIQEIADGALLHDNPTIDSPQNVNESVSFTILRPCIGVSKQCISAVSDGISNVVVTYSVMVTNCGDEPLINVNVTNNVPGVITNRILGPIDLAPFATTNIVRTYTNTADLCGPFDDAVQVTGIGQATLAAVRDSASAQCTITYAPSIKVTKECPASLIEPGSLVVVMGTVTNTGNITLTNVSVTNAITSISSVRRVLGPITLAPGAGMIWTDSYTAPLDSCPPYDDTATAFGADFCSGQIVTDNTTVSCPGTNSPSIVVLKACPPELIQPGGTLTVSGTVTNTGNITLTNVVVTNNISVLGISRRVFGPVSLAPGSGAAFTDSYVVPPDSCGPYADTLTAFGADKCFGRIVTSSDTKACPGTNNPGILVTKACPQNLIQPGDVVNVTGTVTNTGNITLTNVTVTNVIASINATRRVLGPLTLAPGAGAIWTDSYVAPLDSCPPYNDTALASGADKCFGRIVTADAPAICPGTNSPSIDVTKACPPGLIEPGQVLTVSGTVTNTGNITLTNVVVTNNISALGITRLVFGPVTLAPGAGASFTDSYVIPLDSCGPYPDTFAAYGVDKCFGRVVTDSNTDACQGTNSPALWLVKRCSEIPTAPGEITTFSGTISNAGNITLTNVVVVNNQPVENTHVLGPITLAPGESTNFNGSYRVPLNCCTYTDTLTATGADKCFGRVVTRTATAVCQTLTTPKISVTKLCPLTPTPLGQTLVFSGVVSNSGNITLTNVIVVDNQPSNNTPVFGPVTLAPGEFAGFTGGFTVPTDICDTNISDTVTASGVSICTGVTVSDATTVQCPIVPTPKLSLVKRCPIQPVPIGGILNFSGFVSNSGTITITNILVVNNQPTNDTPVAGPFTLLPGQSTNFTGSYQTCDVCCPPYVDMLTATGQGACDGSNVVATATASCPGITTPAIVVSKDCPPTPAVQGQLSTFFGNVYNTGDVVVQNIVVTDSQVGVIAEISALAPGEAVGYLVNYVPTNCGPSVVSMLSAVGADVCLGGLVVDNSFVGCPVTCTNIMAPMILDPRIQSGDFVFSLATELNRTYKVEFSPAVLPTDWQLLTNVPGTGFVVDIHDSSSITQRFYRVSVE